jgi:chemotaxis protein methyltransferase CheR
LLQDGDEGEMINFTNAITTNLTAFFREAHHFGYMKTVVLPELLKKKPMPGGCAYGPPGAQRERSLIR